MSSPSTPLYLTEADVSELVIMTDALKAVRAGFEHQGRGHATHEPRRRVRVPAGVLHVMSAADSESGVMGLKAYTTVKGEARFHVLLYCSETGRLLAVIEASALGRLRTGAASGVATDLLAPADASVLAVIGSGYQAWTQVEAIGHVRNLSEVRVYSRDPDRRRSLSDLLCARLGLWVFPAESPEAALDGAHILATATSSAKPVFPGASVAPGMHLNLAGSNSLLKSEVEAAVVGRADLVTVDSRDAVELEGGDLLEPLQRGWLQRDALVELCQVAVGLHPGRTSPEQVTIFKSHGIALEDIALAAVVYRRAIDQNRGVAIPATV